MNDDLYSRDQEFPDELISAYLDDELSPEDRQRVEEQLMDSVEHRRLFEELKALRSSLQSLPQESLGDDFPQRVLRRAEQELLTGDADAGEAAENPLRRPVSGRVKDGGEWRGLIWSAAAMAAAIALIIYSPFVSERANQPVAVKQADREPAAPAAEGAFAAHDAADDVAETGPRDGIARDGAVPADALPYQSMERVDALADRAAPALPQAEPGLDSLEHLAGRLDARRKTQPSLPRHSTSKDSPAAPGAGAIAAGAGGALARNGLTEKHATPAEARPEISGFAQAAAPLAGRASGGPAGDTAGGTPPLVARPAPDAEAHAARPPQDAGMVVVSMDVTAQALAAQFLEKMLQKHEIHVELAQAEQRAEREAEALDAVELQAVELNKEKKDASGDVELVYVVASGEQIGRLLDDLRNQNEEVLALAYDEPFSGERKQQEGQAGGERQAFRQRAFSAITPASDPQADKAGDEGRGLEFGESASGGKVLRGDLLDETAAEQPRSGDAESFRGIARRLHLPEDLAASENRLRRGQARAAPQSARSALDAAPLAEADVGDNVPLSRDTRNENAIAADADQARAPPAPAAARESEKDERAKAAEEARYEQAATSRPALVRVLFVVRAAE